jgi:ABC-2 type transport system ATP-binding protein
MDDIEALTDRILLIGKGKLLYDGALGALRSRYDRLRRLELHYEGAPSGIPEGTDTLPQPPGTRLISQKDNHAVYEVDTAVIGVSAALRLLGETLDIRDMSAGSRPIEELIAALYRENL